MVVREPAEVPPAGALRWPVDCKCGGVREEEGWCLSVEVQKKTELLLFLCVVSELKER